MEDAKEQWRKAILSGWEKYGDGTPLTPSFVDHLAESMATPSLPEQGEAIFILDSSSRLRRAANVAPEDDR